VQLSGCSPESCFFFAFFQEKLLKTAAIPYCPMAFRLHNPASRLRRGSVKMKNGSEHQGELMSKSRLFIVMNLAMVVGGAYAFAMDEQAGPGSNVPAQPAERTVINWDDMKDRCLHPERLEGFKGQANIKLLCSDTSVEFVPAAPGQLPLAGTRTVVSTVVGDRFQSEAKNLSFPLQGKGGSCLRFKEVEKKLSIEKAITCGEVLSQKADLGQVCQNAVDQMKGANPRLVQVRETGKVVDTCAAFAREPETGDHGDAGAAPIPGAGK
jgi:hypothetical protein